MKNYIKLQGFNRGYLAPKRDLSASNYSIEPYKLELKIANFQRESSDDRKSELKEFCLRSNTKL